MALTRLPSFTLLETDSFTFANITLTSNVTANNANLGNAVTANYFIGSAANLSSIPGANVTGFVPNANVANTAYSVSAANITGTINLANYATTANSVAGANVTGYVANANHANISDSANSVAGANVTGQVSNSALAGTVYTNAQPNITSVGILSTLEVSGNTIIGGNLIVNGTTTTINSTVVQIDDLAVVLANDASTSTQANGAGIIINGAGANMLYINSTNSFTFSHKISADGSLLSNLTAANITGTVASATVAASANSVAAANITGTINLANYATTANSVAGANVTGFVANANVANTAYSVDAANVNGTINLANYATTANSVAGANVTGTVSSATVAASANSVAVANVTGIGNIATLNLDGNSSNILYGNGSFASAPVTYGDSNVASYLPTYTGNLSPGNITIPVSNLKISGGTVDYVLKTDGAGNLSWTAMTGGSGGNGGASSLDELTDVSLSTPADGDVLKFDTDSNLWVNTPVINNVNNQYVTRTYTGDGTDTTFTVSSGTTTDSVIVTLSGIVQTPTTDYSITGTTLTFTSAPANGLAIQIREIGIPMASGTNSQILFNDAGTMAGTAGLTYNKSTNTLFSTKLATTSANLGLVNNIRITGGSAGQVLTTNGNGTVSWASAVIGSTGNSTVLPDSVVDYFTGDGTTDTFTLSIIPVNTSYVLVNIDGVFQFRDSYTLVDDEITFGSAPLNTSRIEVTTLQAGAVQISTFSSSIVPTTDITYDLGNTTHRWRDLYLSGNTLYIGNASVSVSNVTGELSFTPAPTVANPTPVARPTIPDLTNNSGKFLTTDGANVSWGTVDAFPTQTSNSGKYLSTNGSTVSWSSVEALPTQTGNSGKFLTTNGTTATWADYGNLNTPVVTGVTQANETSTQSYTITNYNASYAYIVSVTGGTVLRTNSTISWTLPSVASNTTHYLSTAAVSNGVTSFSDTRTVLVVNVNIDDTAIVVTDFTYNNINSGWTA